MKKLLLVSSILLVLVTSLSGCSSNIHETEQMKSLKQNVKSYSLAKAIYCGSADVKTYYECDEFISVSCTDGSSKFINLTIK